MREKMQEFYKALLREYVKKASQRSRLKNGIIQRKNDSSRFGKIDLPWKHAFENKSRFFPPHFFVTDRGIYIYCFAGIPIEFFKINLYVKVFPCSCNNGMTCRNVLKLSQIF